MWLFNIVKNPRSQSKAAANLKFQELLEEVDPRGEGTITRGAFRFRSWSNSPFSLRIRCLMKKWQSQAGYWIVFSIQTVHFLTSCKRDGLCITTQVLNFLPSQANVRTKQGFSVSVPLKYHHGCLKCHFLIDLGPSRNNLFHFQGFHKNKCPLSWLYILYPPTSPTLATFLMYWEFTKQLSVLTGCNSNSNW